MAVTDDSRSHNYSHGIAVQAFAQMTAVNVIGYYQTILYNSLGITGGRNILVAGIYNCVGPFCNLIFIVFLLDKVGRRKPMLFGSIAVTIVLICEAALTSVNEDGSRTSYSIAGVFFIFCITVIFSFSYGSCAWYVSFLVLQTIRSPPPLWEEF